MSPAEGSGPSLPPCDASGGGSRLMQLIEGYWGSQIVRALASLGVPDLLADGRRHPGELAGAAGADPDALARLLRGAAVLGLVNEAADGFALTSAGAGLRSGAGSLRDAAVGLTDPAFWRSWERLADSVRDGRPAPPRVLGADIWSYYRREPAEGARFAAALNAIATGASADVAARCELPDRAVVVDVAGGHGLLLAEMLARAPAARGVLVDQGTVLGAARELMRARGLTDRVELVEGDLFSEMPAGGDVYVLKSVLHNWGDEEAARIVATCHRAARPGSRLLVISYLLPADGRPCFGHLLDLVMLVQFGGRERTEAEHRALLAGSGYATRRVIPTPGAWSIVEAVRR